MILFQLIDLDDPSLSETKQVAIEVKDITQTVNEKPSKELANYIDSKIMKTKPVNSYPLGITPEGLFSMAGNVWEWCEDWYNEKQNFRVIRGGSFFDLEHYLHCVYRIGAESNERTNYIGFRVVRDVTS